MFRKLCALKVTETRFYVSDYGAKKYFGGLDFSKKVHLSKISGTKIEKTLIIMSQNLLHRLSTC